MQQRFLYGIMAISGLLFVILLDAFLADELGALPVVGVLINRGSAIPLLFAVLVLGAALEMLSLLRSAGTQPHAVVAVVMSVMLLLSPWLCAGGVFGDRPTTAEGMHFQLFWLFVTMTWTVFAQLKRGATRTAARDMAATLLMVVYLGLLPGFAIFLRSYPNIPGTDGAWWVLIFLLVTKVSDIGAYLTGSLIGRVKLNPAVSPGKTWEGAIGAVVASMLLAAAFHSLYPWLFPMVNPEGDLAIGVDAVTRTYRGLHLWQAIVFGALMSIFGQLGDLSESLLKRAAEKKDSGAVLPSFGGMLDLIDSPVLAAPAAWFALTIWWGAI